MADQHESPQNETTTPSHDDVARRAYELFEARGGENGHDLEHWLDAERELSHTPASNVTDEDRSRKRAGER
jgi:DUF2934 family protein